MGLIQEYFRIVEKIKTDKNGKNKPILTFFNRWMHLVMKGEMENSNYPIEY